MHFTKRAEKIFIQQEIYSHQPNTTPSSPIRRCSEKRVKQGDFTIMELKLRRKMFAAIAVLFITMLAMPVHSWAQGTAKIILEAHDVWGDGSGYQLLLDADHNLYGDKIPVEGPIWDNNNPPADLYNGFEYTIPVGADPSTTPKHMVVDGEESIEIPAGIYDFCIAAPQAGTKIWIAGDADGPTRGNDYKFEAGKTYRFTMHIVHDVNNDGAKLLITEDGKIETYQLWVAGTQVTSDNCNDLPHTKGIVLYDPSTKVLSLYDATINVYGTDEAIKTSMNDLTIRMEGTNTLASTDGHALNIEKGNCTITGGGKMELTGKNFGLYVAPNASLTIDNSGIESKGSVGNELAGAEITINNASVRAKGNTYASMCGIQTLSLNGCSIVQPKGASFDASLAGVALNGQLVKDEVVIKAQELTYYDIEVAGTRVTSANYKTLSKLDNVSGTILYDPATNVLTFQDVSVAGTINAVVSHSDGLTIKLIGNNNLTTEYVVLSFTAPLTITGGGTLNAKSLKDCAIYANQTDLTIDNCTVNAESTVYGIAGDGGEKEHLTIKNADVTAIGPQYGSVSDFASLTLIGCNIVQPEGATFDPAKHGIVLNDDPVKTKVTIKKDPTGISAATAEPTVPQSIYSVSGVRLSGEFKNLPKGVYIVNGRKVVKP
jgi:arginine-specific protease argI polyprotein